MNTPCYYSQLEREAPHVARRLRFRSVSPDIFECLDNGSKSGAYAGFWHHTEDADLVGPWPTQAEAERALSAYFEAL